VSNLAAKLAFQYRCNPITAGYVPEFGFCKWRKWRADFAFPEHRLLIEVDGGVWTQGRHTRGAGYIADCEKFNAAAMLGWRVLRFCEPHITDLSALDLTIALIQGTIIKQLKRGKK